MSAVPKLRMKADEFIAWSMRQPEGRRYELAGGEVIAMSPEQLGHTRIKYLVWQALRDGVRSKGLDCEVIGDGITVRIDEETVYEPDAVVRRGAALPAETVEIADPVVVVEVTSPSTEGVDTGAKFADYFRLESLRHYVIVKGATRTVIHHGRTQDGRMATAVMRSGRLDLDPEGLSINIESVFPPA